MNTSSNFSFCARQVILASVVFALGYFVFHYLPMIHPFFIGLLIGLPGMIASAVISIRKNDYFPLGWLIYVLTIVVLDLIF